MSYTVTDPSDDGFIEGTLRYGIMTGEPLIIINSDLVPSISVLSSLNINTQTEIIATGTTTLVGANPVVFSYMFEVLESLTIRNLVLTSSSTNFGFRIESNGNLTMENCIMENFGNLDPSAPGGVCINAIINPDITIDIILTDCIFRNNRSVNSGTVLWCSLAYFSNFNLRMTNVIDENNGGIDSGGSVHITQSTYPEPRKIMVEMTSCTITGANGTSYGNYLIEPMNSTELSLTMNNCTFNDAVFEINSVGEDFGSPLPDSSLININVLESTFNGRGLTFACSNASGTVETNIELTDTGFYNGGYFSSSTTTVVSSNVNVDINRCSFVGGDIFRAVHLENLVNNSAITAFIQNTTIADSPGYGIHVRAANFGQIVLEANNLTISNNSVGVQLDTMDGGVGTLTFYNSIIAGNIADFIEDNEFGVPSYTTTSCITDATNLNIQPPSDNGGFTRTMAIDQTSSAFNAGNNSYVLSVVDQRGFPRIAYGTVDAGAYEFQEPFVVCLRGDAKVLVDSKYIPIKSVKTNDLVFDLHSKEYVPVLKNIVTEKARKFMLIAKDSIDTNVPNEDLYITTGHVVEISGKHIKAKNVPKAKLIHCEPQLVYSIVTETPTFIDINGLPVYTWGLKKWENKSQTNNSWIEQ